MTNQAYSLFQVRTDGNLTAPRWLHHVIKIATHTSVTFLLVCFHVPIVNAAFYAGPAFWLVLALHEHFWPSDIQPLTLWQHVADWMTDCACACVPMVGALVFVHAFVLATALATISYVEWLVGHKDARP